MDQVSVYGNWCFTLSGEQVLIRPTSDGSGIPPEGSCSIRSLVRHVLHESQVKQGGPGLLTPDERFHSAADYVHGRVSVTAEETPGVPPGMPPEYVIYSVPVEHVRSFVCDHLRQEMISRVAGTDEAGIMALALEHLDDEYALPDAD